MPATIIPIATAEGTRYAVVVGAKPVTDFSSMTEAAMWAERMGLEATICA